MGPLVAIVLIFTILNHLEAQTLTWDDNAHTSFSLTIDHNMSETIILNQITYNTNTYELVDPIIINETNSILTTIQTFMSFEDPIDDIKQAAAGDSVDYRSRAYDYQSITRAKGASLLELVHSGTFEYNLDVSIKHLFKDGTLLTVYMKQYPITAACPGSCVNPTDDSFSPSYAGSAGCNQDCNFYNCTYLNEHWGGGACVTSNTLLLQDNNITAIESLHEAWWVVIQGDSVSYRIALQWGKDEPNVANQVYNNRWGLKYLSQQGADINKECSAATVYWDNGHHDGELYSPTTAYGNEYRKVSYSLKNISVISQPSVPITIGSHSDTHGTTNGDPIKQAISDKFSYQRIIIDDVGYHDYTTTASLSNSSNWLFINNTYFGFDCDQIMVDQLTWQAAPCDTCLDHVLSTWRISEHGITTIPYYNDLDLSNGIEQAIEVVTNLTTFSENDIAINFNYVFPISSISISSSDFAFKQPNACNTVSQVYISPSTKSTNVSFNNCGTLSADFKYTINCANGYTSTTPSAATVAINGVQSDWTQSVTNTNCNSVSSITISTTSCPEFWDNTCTWITTMTTITPEPTPIPTPNPTPSPTPIPTMNPSFSPTAAPVSFLDSCTSYQVVPVRGAILNTIIHQELCLPSSEGYYIVDINAQKPYYIVIDSGSVSNTTINKINEDDYDTGINSGIPATGSALIGHSMILIETWYNVLAYLGLYLSQYSSLQSIYTSIKIDGLTIETDLPSTFFKDVFKTNLVSQIVTQLELIDDNQITVNSLRSGSIIANIIISSSTISNQSPLEITVALQNYIAFNEATSVSITEPLNSVNNYFYNNQTHFIVFTNCPFTITATTWEGYTVSVSWEEPTIKTSVNDNDINVYQAIGDRSGESFAAGSYFVRYVALSVTNSSLTPAYCSFVIIVDEKEWVLEFMGIEFSITTLIIIGTVLFCICTGSIVFSMRKRCRKTQQPLSLNSVNNKSQQGNFKSVIVSSHDTTDPKSPKLKITRASAPLLDDTKQSNIQ